MLRSLHIRNYVLIDSLDVDFPEGLVIITGQTGAGKSILLGALSLVTGAKADAGIISEGADSCVVEAEFDTDPRNEDIIRILDENDVERDGGHLIVRRVVNSSGRARCFVNDSPVQAGVLSSLASLLIDIHSQHQSLLLTDRKFQLSVLDHFAGNSVTLSECRSSWLRLSGIRSELAKAEEKRERLSADRDYNEAQYRQLEGAGLKEGELEELEAEQKQLSNAESIKEGLGSAFNALDGFASLKEVKRTLEHIGRFVPALDGICERLESARIELDDIRAELEDMDSRVIMSSDRLEMVEDRMSLLYSLLKKHNCSSVTELVAKRDEFNEALYDSDSLNERINELKEAHKKEEAVFDGLCNKLHESRVKAAPAFEDNIINSLRFLELDNSVFRIGIEPSKADASGADAITFLFSSNGSEPVDVARCASGGEISRIMLCLKAMMAKFADMPTLIFDEIDTGVSGSVADKMGSMICDMGQDMQVFSITHLPQVAAKGDAHYLVTKSTRQGRTISGIQSITGEERTMEIARMLSGSSITPEAIANAESLLRGHAK